jgi:hypothetical protein
MQIEKALRFSFLMALTLPALALASFRCEKTGKIVEEGMTVYEVLSACGEPALKTTIQGSDSTVAHVEGETVVIKSGAPGEDWTYDFGPSRFIQTLRFENGTLRKIARGGYGSKLGH